MQSRIFVVKLKDIIRTAVFTVLGIAIIVAVIAFVFGGRGEYKEGTYTSGIILHGSPVEVEVKVSKNAIESITLGDMGETQAVFYPTFNSCFEELAAAVIENQSTDIELNKDYEVAESILLDAVDNALEQAKR